MNLEQLKWRLDLFDGKRIVAVATGPETNTVDDVRRHLGDEVEYIVIRNNPVLREVETWPILWERLGQQGPADAVFCAHAKGVTRPVNKGVTIHRWASLLYTVNLDYWPAVAELLVRYPVVGSLKKIGFGFEGSQSSWHYSGTYYWVRYGDAQGRWQIIDKVWWGTESWPGIHWAAEFAGCLFHTGHVPGLDMYRLDYLNNVIDPEFFQWRAKFSGKSLYNLKRAVEYWS